MSEITKTENQRPKTKDRIIRALFALIIISIYFFALGNFPLIGPDEPRYAQVAREMFERNDWITPTLGGFDWFEKPALLYWLQIIFYKIFGVSEFSARFGSALFGLGTVLSLWILGRFSATEDTEKAREYVDEKMVSSNPSVSSVAKNDFANWLALIAASSIGLLVFSRGASFDIILTFPITAALVSFFIFDRSKTKSFTTYHLPLTTFYFFIGVALLAKGLVGIVFPFAIVAFYFVLSRKLPERTFIFSLFWGTILSLLVASIWYLPMYLTNGWKFIDEFFLQHHFQRFASDKYRHWQPFWFFWVVLPLMTIPWLPFFLASIWNLFKVKSPESGIKSPKQKVESQKDSPRPRVSGSPRLAIPSSPLLLFSLSWLLVPLIFFSLSGSKLPGYILPALPPALILTAEYICRFVGNRPKRKLALQLLALFTFLIVGFLLQFVVPKYAENDSVKYLISAADERGFSDRKIVNLYVVWHNAEFYAAGRMVREPDGKLKQYKDFSVLVQDLKRENAPDILVFVPAHALKIVTESQLVETEVLGKNNETALVLIKPKI